MTRRLANKVFASAAGANRDDVGVNEVHDCMAANEVQYVLCCPRERQHAALNIFGTWAAHHRRHA